MERPDEAPLMDRDLRHEDTRTWAVLREIKAHLCCGEHCRWSWVGSYMYSSWEALQQTLRSGTKGESATAQQH